MNGRWATVTLAADTTKPHDEALRWVTARAGAGVERIRVVSADGPREGRPSPDGPRVADAVADAARAAMPDAEVEVRWHAGPSTTALVDESEDGDVLVIGVFRNRRGTTAGAEPARIAARAAVPTVIVPEGPHPIEGDVVLAVEEPIDHRAVEIAVAEAHRRHRRVTLIRAWEMPVLTRTGLTDFAEEPMRWKTRNAELLQRVATELAARHPDVRFHQLLVEGHPGRAIAAHTRQASLVVLGHGHVGSSSGSVLRDVLHDTASPVCVVPPAAHAEPLQVSA